MNLIYAFLGGMLLNLMPCCLPALSLKVASKKDSTWFAAGMLSVFVALGGLAAVLGLGWGSHTQSQPFIVGLTAVTFICGLSYLGAWSFPAFGFRDRSSDFGKGVLAALLSTSCSGPFLGPVFAWTLTQSPWMTFAVFMSVGLGMVLPFLLPIPLPKPGDWMESVKQFAGFGMIGTALWLLSGVSDAWLFPTLILLLLLAVACRYPRVWWIAILAIAPFNMSHSTNWQEYSPERMRGDEIVLVTFSTKLCLTCDMNLAVLNSERVQDAVKRGGIIQLYADVANNADAALLLRKLGFDSVPVLAIFPRGGRPPIVLPDLISSEQVIDAIESATH